MAPYAPRSLFSRFLRDTVLGLAMVLSCAFLIVLAGITIKQRVDLNSDRVVLSRVLSQGLKAALWHYDVRAIDDTIQAYEFSGQIEFALVEDQYGSALSDRNYSITRPPDQLVPIPSEFGGIAGHLKIWWHVQQPLLSTQNLLLAGAALIIMLLVAITLSLLIRIALRRHILTPLNTMRMALLSHDEKLSLESHTSLFATHEFNSFREAFEQMQKRLQEERQRRQEAYLGQEKALARQQQSSSALIALFEVVGQTMIVIDNEGEDIACHVSRPFLSRHIGQLRAIASEPTLIETVMAEFGFDDLKEVPHSDPERRAVEFRSGSSLYLATTLPLSVGQAVIVHDITTESNMEAAMDEILDATQTGIALFSEKGELKNVRGASLERLSESELGQGGVPIVVQRLLSGDISSGAVEIGERHYQLQFEKLRSGLICVSHTDVSEARQAERALQKDRNLRNMGQLTSGIAHDFNNILGVIIGNLELIERRHDETEREFLDEALRAAKTGSSTVRHLLAYSRNKALSVQATDLDQLISENIKLLRNAAGQGIDVTLQTNAGAICEIDQSMLISAVLNLVVNARDAMGGNGQIAITTSASADPERPARYLARIEVQDTGPGVPVELQRDIFEPYYTTKPQQLGTGLGLSMVKGFLESLGGSVTQTNNDKGALFVMELPSPRLKTAADLRVVADQSAPAVADFKPKQASRRHILLVDDESALLRVNKLNLSRAGYHVHDFENPVAALEWLQEGFEIDLLITDYAMPNLTGLELVAAIDKPRGSFPVLLCSGNLSEEILSQAREVGVANFMEKPCSTHDLRAKVENLLTADHVAQAAKARPASGGMAV